MNTLRMMLLSLGTLIAFLAPVSAQAGTRDVQIRARVRVPGVSVEIGHRHRDGYNNSRHLRVDRNYHNQNKEDRKIARRLASYSGIPKYKIMRLRDRGLRWTEIGYRLNLPRQVVRAAYSAKSWRRFMKPAHWCGTRSH